MGVKKQRAKRLKRFFEQDEDIFIYGAVIPKSRKKTAFVARAIVNRIKNNVGGLRMDLGDCIGVN